MGIVYRGVATIAAIIRRYSNAVCIIYDTVAILILYTVATLYATSNSVPGLDHFNSGLGTCLQLYPDTPPEKSQREASKNRYV